MTRRKSVDELAVAEAPPATRIVGVTVPLATSPIEIAEVQADHAAISLRVSGKAAEALHRLRNGLRVDGVRNSIPLWTSAEAN